MNQPEKSTGSGSRDANAIGQLPQILARLIENPKRLSGQRLWMCLEDHEKRVALTSYIDQDDGRDHLVALIASARNFRTRTVAKWDNGKIVEVLKNLSLTNVFAIRLLHAFHTVQDGMCKTFLDALGIQNENGQMSESLENAGTGLSQDSVHGAANTLLENHEWRNVVLYFMTLACQRTPLEPHLLSWLAGITACDEIARPVEPESIEPDGADRYEDAERESSPDSDRLTTLDTLVRNAIAASKSGIAGAPKEDEIHDIVDEFLSLNAQRHHTHFHNGFRDAVFDRQLGLGLVSEGSRWYWAGVVNGLAHLARDVDILKVYDDNPIVRRLGDGEDAATDEAALYVVRSLKHAKRPAEVAEFVKPKAIRKPGSPLFQEMLEIGTDLLYEEGPGEARLVFDRLMDAVRDLEKQGFPPAHARFLTVRRRQAHCLRLLNEHEKAREFLTDLQQLEPDPNNQAMVHADLGMLAGDFNRLEEVSLPPKNADLADFMDRLEEGSNQYRQSIRQDVQYASHGHYCLGVLEIGNRRFDKAPNHFERARGHFRSKPTSYSKSLIGRTNLYLGIAKAGRAQSSGDLNHAAGIMMDAMESGIAFPSYLIDPTLAGLEIGTSSEVFSKFVSVLLKQGSEDALDVLASNDTAVATGTVSAALREKARKLGRCEESAKILRNCLGGCLMAGRRDEAEEILGELEHLAIEGAGTKAFQALLRFPANYQLAWSEEEAIVARAHGLEACGDFEEALVVMKQLFYRYAAKNDLYAAKGILEHIRGYGLPETYYVQESNRLKALLKSEDTPTESSEEEIAWKASKPLKVLFIGGDERQAKLESDIRENLKKRTLHVDVTFIFSGWSSNWNKYLEEVKSELAAHDMLVLMGYMRTNLGREIRKSCGKKQWRTCWATGSNGIADSIVAAARDAESYNTSPSAD